MFYLSTLSFYVFLISCCVATTQVASQDVKGREYNMVCWTRETSLDKIEDDCGEYLEEVTTQIEDFMCSVRENEQTTKNTKNNNRRVLKPMLRQAKSNNYDNIHRELRSKYSCSRVCVSFIPHTCQYYFPHCKQRRVMLETEFDSASTPQVDYSVTVDNDKISSTTANMRQLRPQNHRQLDSTCFEEVRSLRRVYKRIDRHYRNMSVDDVINDADYFGIDLDNDGDVDTDDQILGEELKKQKEIQIEEDKQHLMNKKKCAKLLTDIVCRCDYSLKLGMDDSNP